MVMEFLEGNDLAHLVKQRGALPGQEAIEYVLQACEALAEAHVAGIVHRDLKPANLFLTHRADGSPCIKVLDFGISKVTVSPEGGLTQTSAMMGSPNYMAPEQLRSARDVDARSDIWALGIILHELLTGEVAFKADTLAELHVAILQGQPTILRARRPDAPPAMEAIILRCLEKDPARRFANVAELATALGELAPPGARLSVERIKRIIGAQTSGSSAFTPVQATHPSGVGVAPTVAGTSYPPAAPMQPYTAQHTPQPPGLAPTYGAGPSYPQRNSGPYPPTYATAPTTPARAGMSPATIALIVLASLVVLGLGSCSFCVCLGAAAGSGQQSSTEPASLPFQHSAGWTTVSARERLHACYRGSTPARDFSRDRDSLVAPGGVTIGRAGIRHHMLQAGRPRQPHDPEWVGTAPAYEGTYQKRRWDRRERASSDPLEVTA